MVRATLLRLVLEYWRHHGADWMPHEAMIKAYIDRHGPVLDKRTVGHVLDSLVRADVLRRFRTGRHLHYQLSRRHMDPTWPGFARTIDDLLVDPVSWVDPDGTFFRVGRRSDADQRIFVVPTFPYYFVQHTWTRAWIHALNRGLFAMPHRGLTLVREAAREAPIQVLWQIHEAPNGPAETRLAETFEASRMYRKTRTMAAADQWIPFPKNRAATWIGAWAEAGMHLLHAACGHASKNAPTNGRPSRLDERLDEETVYLRLDDAVRVRLEAKLRTQDQPYMDRVENWFMDSTDPAWVWAVWEERREQGIMVPRHPIEERLGHPPLELLESWIRAMTSDLRSTMSAHRWAYPVIPVSPFEEENPPDPSPFALPSVRFGPNAVWQRPADNGLDHGARATHA